MARRPRTRKIHNLELIDHWVWTIVGVLLGTVGLLLWFGDHTAPVVQGFSWQGQQVTARDQAFILTFSRPMDRASVEQNLRLDPPLKGKFSWSGRRMAYTLTAPLIYGTTYTLQLANAFDRLRPELGNKAPLQPFSGQFYTPDPQLAFVDYQGRLQLYDLKHDRLQTLTPPNLQITDYRFDPQRQSVVFLGITPPQPLLDQQLYRLNLRDRALNLVISDPQYQNFRFDLAPDGETIVVQRLSRRRPGEYGLWVIRGEQPPRALEQQPGGEFQIAPDSNSLAIAQGEGIAILALEPDIPPLDYLPRFGSILSFAPSGRQVATIAFNKDFTRSLYVVDNTGEQTELVRLKGSILSAQFAPLEQELYCVLAPLDATSQEYREEPYLAVIDLKTKKLTKLLDLTGEKSVSMQVAPDGQYLAIATGDPSQKNTRIRIMQLPHLHTITTLAGSQPRWLP